MAMEPSYIIPFIQENRDQQWSAGANTHVLGYLPEISAVGSTGHSVAGSDCAIANVSLTYTEPNGGFAPIVGMNVTVPNYDDSNYSANTELRGAVTSIERANQVITLGFTTMTAIGKSGACQNLGLLPTGTIYTGDRSYFATKIKSTWTDLDALKALNHISASEYAYYVALQAMLKGDDAGLPQSAELVQVKNNLDNSAPMGLLSAVPVTAGGFAELINSVSGLSTFADGSVKGVKATFNIALSDTASRGSQTLPQWTKTGNVWSLTQDTSSFLTSIDVSGNVPINDIELAAAKWAGWRQAITVNGVILSCNCSFSKSTATWTISDLVSTSASSNPNVAPAMSMIPGYKVTFNAGSAGSNKKVKAALKTNAGVFKSASAVKVIAIKDGHPANAAKVARNATLAKNRANRIKAQLRSLGVSASKITIAYEVSGASTSDAASKAAVNQAVVTVS